MSASARPTVVLVHGGFVDGSGWRGVYDRLKADGHRISVVQNPTLSLDGDVAATKQALDDIDGPVVLVGHSYGGVVITETGKDPRVAGLVYIAAFAPDKGESVNTLLADLHPGLRCRRSSRLATVSSSWSATSSTTRSPETSPTRTRRSWRTHRCRGASTRSSAR